MGSLIARSLLAAALAAVFTGFSRADTPPPCDARLDAVRQTLEIACRGATPVTVALRTVGPGDLALTPMSAWLLAPAATTSLPLDRVTWQAAREGRLVLELATPGLDGGAWRIAATPEAILFACSFEAGTACGIWSAVASQELCNGLDDDCDTVVDDGFDLGTDPLNCGSCGHACGPYPHATPGCSGGTCGIGSCLAGYADCNGTVADGCEADLRTDPDHCGDCMVVCAPPPNATRACRTGECGIGACNASWADCDGVLDNGCEANLVSDPAHCGTCTTACAFTNATASCTAAMCTIASCNAGWGNCDGNTFNGCETNVTSNPAHCGACNLPCGPLPHATAGCAAASCTIASCNAGWANCDGSVPNGCEVSTQTDPLHCGGCGTVCPAYPHSTATCMSAVCAIACNSPWANCDNNTTNGCEVDISSNLSHCGACFRPCGPYVNATAVCNTGMCDLGLCLGESYDCNATVADGCEATDSPTGNHTPSVPLALGTFSCSDTASDPGILGRLPSDRRQHAAFDGFDAALGAAPDWHRLNASGGACVNDLSMTLTVSAPGCPTCYRLTVYTDLTAVQCDTGGAATCSVARGAGAYSSGSVIHLVVEKTCSSASCIANATYTVHGHL